MPSKVPLIKFSILSPDTKKELSPLQAEGHDRLAARHKRRPSETQARHKRLE